jgi:hypothetical protein
VIEVCYVVYDAFFLYLHLVAEKLNALLDIIFFPQLQIGLFTLFSIYGTAVSCMLLSELMA